jgi:hypothetical protein
MLGIIAEDCSDVEVIHEILKKYINPRDIKVKKFVGNGCGKLRNKCDSWTDNLFKQGCEYVFIFHDLDRYKEKDLRATLEKKVCPKKNSNSLIIIPTEELEAWLLSDTQAIKKVFNLKKDIKDVKNSEQIKSPKEYIRDLVFSAERKTYLNTVHNKKIAQEIKIEKFNNCMSYKPFHKFITEKVCA